MKIGIIFILAFYVNILNSQTYFGSASNPTDNGTLGQTTVSVTPPASMVAGDLVIIIGHVRTTSSSVVMNATGGQNWNDTGMAMNRADLTGRAYWCRFNGTWLADPSMDFGSTTSTTVVMHVFRPTASTKTWGLEQTPTVQNFTPSGNLVLNATNPTSVNNNAVYVFGFMTPDDNTWLINAGSQILIGSDQYRNTSGTDQSSVYYRSILPTAGSGTGNLRVEETAEGPDDGTMWVIGFYEYTPTNRGIPWYFLRQ